MNHLFSMRASTLMVICGISYLLTAGQTVHACYASVQQDGRFRWLRVWYEVMLAIHLLFVCAVSNSALENQGAILLWLHPVLLGVEVLLWANALTAVLGGVCAIRLRRPWMAAEVALLACCTPPVIAAMGEGSSLLLIADVSFFAARVFSSLALDVRDSKTLVSRLSLVDALEALPEGVMWVSERGEVLFMNDAMRGSLTSLGLATDLADARGLWERLESHAREVDHDRLIIETGSQTARLFVHDTVVLRKRRCRRIMALDVTEEVAINARLESVNRLLEAANEELRASMQQVRKVAEAEAIMRMKARVHDTIGSRLSILHRFLEDDRDGPRTLKQVTGLLNSIVDDLAETDLPAASAGLESICSAFSLVGVEVRVVGELPSDETVARAFAEIVLEAVTNAAKHAQACRVDVRVCRGPGGAVALSVTNDGCVPEEIVEGTGIPGMRRIAAAVGASFDVSAGPPFSVEVVLPASEDGTVSEAWAGALGSEDQAFTPETQDERGRA